MVDVAVRENHRCHRLVAQMLARKSQCRCRTFSRGQRIDHDPAGFALDQRHVCHVKTAHLVNAVRYLEQADLGIEQRVAPQARIDGGRRLAFDKFVGIEVQQDSAISANNLTRGARDETALGVIKVLRVVEFEQLGELLVGLEGQRRGIAGRAANPRTFVTAGNQCQQRRQQRPG